MAVLWGDNRLTDASSAAIMSAMTINPDKITLILPPLFSRPHAVPAQRLPALERILACAEQARTSGDVFTLLAAGAGLQGRVPVATLTRLGHDGAPGKGGGLFADPVHLLPNRDHLVLLAGRELALTAAEAEALLAVLNEYFLPEAWVFSSLSPHRWLLGGVETAGLRTTSLARAEGRNVSSLLPRGDAAGYWRSRLTEAQMLLHQAPVNERRRARGLPEINSVWLWGEGELPAAPAAPLPSLWGGDAFVRGLARWSGTPWQALPADAETVMAAGSARVVFGDTLDGQWYDEWEDFDQHWCVPLLQGLKQGRYAVLELCFGEHRLRLQRRDLRRFWRRRVPLQNYCRAEAG